MADRLIAALALGVGEAATDPHTQAREIVAAELVDDRLQPVVTAGTATCADPQAAERQVKIVADHEDLGPWSLPPRRDLANRPAAFVHERQRLDEDDAFP